MVVIIELVSEAVGSSDLTRTLSSYLLYHLRPICCTRYLSTRGVISDLQKPVRVLGVLYSFPVCGASFFSTWPGATCLRAGLSFFCFLTTCCCCGTTAVSVSVDAMRTNARDELKGGFARDRDRWSSSLEVPHRSRQRPLRCRHPIQRGCRCPRIGKTSALSRFRQTRSRFSKGGETTSFRTSIFNPCLSRCSCSLGCGYTNLGPA